jgi:photosystem II stability/assembly factor-like uncharacterized protein
MRKIYLALLLVLCFNILNAQWTAQTSGTTQTLRGVFASTGGDTAWAVGPNHTVLRTINGGTVWNAIANPGLYDHLDVKFRPDNLRGWIATGEGVMYTINAGTTWTNVSFATGVYVFGVDFFSNNDGLAAATTLGIFKTADGGLNWNQILSIPDVLFSKIEYGSDVNTAWAVGWDPNNNAGKIYKLTNSGGIWNNVLQYDGPANSMIDGLTVIDNNTAYATSATVGVLKTTDGINWLPQTTVAGSGATNVFAVDANRVIASRGDGSIIYTNDGTAWSLHAGNPNPNSLYDVYAVNSDVAYAVGVNGTIIKTSNLLLPVSFSSFIAQSQNKKVHLNWSTSMELNNTGFAIMRRTTTSNNWEQVGFVRSFGNSNSTQSYSFIDEPKGGETFLYQLKQIDIDGKSSLSNILKVKLEIDDASLVVYPNPFKGQTTINYSVPTANKVQLVIRNQFGEIVKTVVNAKQQTGNYAVTVNANELASGSYYAELRVGENKKTVKLNLIR